MTRPPGAQLLEGLNEPQRRAVEVASGPVLVLAGAGSGKTRVLAHRVAFLISAQGVRPHEILAITFTNKAAGEMKERIEALVGPIARTMWISTFHSACARILRKEAQRLGYQRNFSIYDAPDQVRLVKRCLKELDLDEKRFPPRGIHTVISSAKNQLIGAEDFAGMTEDFFDDTVAQVYRLYQKKLFANNAMDFDDLLVRTVELFQNFTDRLEHYQGAFRHILVDEYQDTNHAQYVLVNLLGREHRNICVVGDDDQSIYSWRGADVRNILDFEKDYPEAVVIKLEQNYRSTQTILTAANHVVGHNRDRKPKALWTELGNGDPVTVAELDDEHAEARFVAGEAMRLQQDEGYRPQDIAVFYRVNAQSRVLEDILVRYGIAYRVVGGTKFYERAEIKDAVAYLTVIDNPADTVNFGRIINSPKRGAGAATVASLTRYAESEGLTMPEAATRAGEIADIRAAAQKSLTAFSDLLLRLGKTATESPVAETLDEALTASGYIEALQAERTIEAEGRIENLMELVGVAEEYDRRSAGEGSLREFLQEISLYTDIDKLAEASEALTLMTLHNAKGLEFPAVFIIGAEEGIFPHSRSLEEQNLEEERRLCYVGMTRAMKRLYFCYTTTRNLYGGRSYNMASRFLGEIPDELIKFESKAGPARIGGSGFIGLEPEISDVAVSIGVNAPETSFFHTGDKVVHAVFGDGVVKAVERGGTVAVRFVDGSERKLMVDYAPLKKK